MARRGLGPAALNPPDKPTLSDIYALLGVKAYKSGRYYPPFNVAAAAATVASVAGRIVAFQFVVPMPINLSLIGVRINTVQAGSNHAFAIYGTDAYGAPVGAPLFASGNLSGATSGAVDSASGVILPAGTYWFAWNCDTAGLVLAGVAYSGSNPQAMAAYGGAAEAAIAQGAIYYSLTQAFANGWPSSPVWTETASTTIVCPLPHWRAT